MSRLQNIKSAGIDNKVPAECINNFQEVQSIKSKMEDVDEFKLDMTQRVAKLEEGYSHIMKSIDDIKRDSSLNVKLTAGLILAIISAAISFLFKSGG